ncbi:MAG: TRAP transporter TatT component family protein [Acidobacteriota bacterium]|jgi:predicted anti-sigma-YlaC factor YlaD
MTAARFDVTTRRRLSSMALIAALLASPGCSVKQMAVNSLTDVLGQAEVVYLSDEDPELIAGALPYQVKTIETLLASNPDNPRLLLAATTAIVLYGYGFVEPEAERLEYVDFYRSEEIRLRAARLYVRAYRYGLHGLDVAHPGIAARLPIEPEAAAGELTADDLALTVWTGAALGAAIGAATDDPDLTVDIAVVGALLERALELDEDYDDGLIQGFLFSYEIGRAGGSMEKARKYYERALELSGGKRCSLWLGWAESVSVPNQDRAEFDALLTEVIDFDVDSYPEGRLLNILAQRRAHWLQSNADELFWQGGEGR